MIPGIKEEQLLLLDCLENPNDVKFPQDFDLHKFAYWLDRHRLRPQLSLFLERNENVPKELRDYLLKFRHLHFYKNLHIIGEWVRIHREFKNKGVDILPYKGPFLSQKLFENPGIRECYDLDVLVKKRDLKDVQSLLKHLGYVCRGSKEFIDRNELFLEAESEIDYFHPEKKLSIDLHWRTNQPSFAFAFDSDCYFEKAPEIEMQGHRFKAFDENLEFVLLCVHGARSRWTNLCHLIDIKMILEKEYLNWHEVMSYADQFRVNKVIAQTLILAKRFGKYNLPDFVEQKLKKYYNDKLIQFMYKVWFASDEVRHVKKYSMITPLERFLYYMNCRESLNDKMRCIKYTYFWPSLDDIQLLRLPKKLLFVYYLFKPCRLLLFRPIKSIFVKK